jgi:hypothetical protein
VCELAVGEPQDPVAGSCQRRVSLAVSFEGAPRAVHAPAVGLDGEAVAGEEEVDLEIFDVGVDLWAREAVRSAERQEGFFELALGESGSGVVALEGLSERRVP